MVWRDWAYPPPLSPPPAPMLELQRKHKGGNKIEASNTDPALRSHSRSERKRAQSECDSERRVQKEKEHSTCVKCSFSFCDPIRIRT